MAFTGKIILRITLSFCLLGNAALPLLADGAGEWGGGDNGGGDFVPLAAMQNGNGNGNANLVVNANQNAGNNNFNAFNPNNGQNLGQINNGVQGVQAAANRAADPANLVPRDNAGAAGQRLQNGLAQMQANGNAQANQMLDQNLNKLERAFGVTFTPEQREQAKATMGQVLSIIGQNGGNLQAAGAALRDFQQGLIGNDGGITKNMMTSLMWNSVGAVTNGLLDYAKNGGNINNMTARNLNPIFAQSSPSMSTLYASQPSMYQPSMFTPPVITPDVAALVQPPAGSYLGIAVSPELLHAVSVTNPTPLTPTESLGAITGLLTGRTIPLTEGEFNPATPL